MEIINSIQSVMSHGAQETAGVPAPFMSNNNGDDVNLLPGSQFTIVLPENGTTGFQWQVKGLQDEPFKSMFEVVSNEYIPPAQLHVGAAGARVVTVKVKEDAPDSVRADFTLHYGRVGEAYVRGQSQAFTLAVLASSDPSTESWAACYYGDNFKPGLGANPPVSNTTAAVITTATSKTVADQDIIESGAPNRIHRGVGMPAPFTGADNHNGVNKVLSVGQVLHVVLPENPTTGDRWADQVHDNDWFELLKSEYVSASPQLIGSGGSRVYTFRVKQDHLRWHATEDQIPATLSIYRLQAGETFAERTTRADGSGAEFSMNTVIVR